MRALVLAAVMAVCLTACGPDFEGWWGGKWNIADPPQAGSISFQSTEGKLDGEGFNFTTLERFRFEGTIDADGKVHATLAYPEVTYQAAGDLDEVTPDHLTGNLRLSEDGADAGTMRLILEQ